MGKGDKRSRRGKIYRGTFGVTRPKPSTARKRKKAAAQQQPPQEPPPVKP